jgi:hypothetical protein
MTPPRLGARDGAFTLDGRRVYLFDGELHYFRVRPALWRDGLERLKAAGMNAVSTYIPWVWHEVEEGHFDFTGETNPARDLGTFLTACREVGLVVMVRPGPLIYAEFDGLGIPLWLGDRYPDTVVVRRDGRREQGDFFWSHSLGHPVYRAKARAWYEAVASFLSPWWNDPVISFQLDNETGLMFANRVGQIDFNPDTLARYRSWLTTEYESIDALNAMWSTKHASFAQVLPPRPPLLQPEVVDWQRFLEDWIDDYLEWLARTAKECGVPVPLTHNEQGIQHSPLHAQKGPARIDFFGYDIYPKASPGKFTADFPFAGSLYPGMFSAYRTPERPTLAVELGTGWFDPRTKVSDIAIAQNIFGSLAHGARGLCLFPMHDGREPSGEPYSFGAPIDEMGKPTTRYQLVSDVGRFLARWGDDLLAMDEVYDPVGFGIYFPNFRYAAQDYFHGTEQVDPHRYLAFLANSGLHALLLCAGVNPQVVDLRELLAKPLAELQILFLSTKGMLDAEVYDKLENWTLGGGHLVTAPGPPDRDLHGRPARYSTLFPLEPLNTEWLDELRVWATVIAGVVPYFLFERPWLSDRHKSSAHVMDLFEPLLDALRSPVRGRRFEVRPVIDVPGPSAATSDDAPALDAFEEESEAITEASEPADASAIRVTPPLPRRVNVPDASPPSILGDYVSRIFPIPRDPEEGVRPGPLWLGDHPAAYEVALGWGSSTVLGTLPAGRYLTPRYYAMPARERRALRHFARGLLADRNVTPHIHADVEAEIVGHAGENGGMLFFINRLGAQTGNVRFVDPDVFGFTGKLEIAYTFLGSGARVVDKRTLRVELAAEDVLVLRLT